MKPIRTVFSLFRQTFEEWNNDGVPRLAAALAYYAAFSLAPLLVVVIALVGVIVDEQAVRSQITTQAYNLLGAEAARQMQELIAAVNRPAEGVVASILGLVGLLFGALGVFENLQTALNIIWNVTPPQGAGILFFIKNKLLSFGMILIVGLLLLISLVISAILAIIGNWFLQKFPETALLLQIINWLISYGVVTLLFAAIFKVLPAVRLSWRDVWIGSALTSLLFSVGKHLLAQYLANTSTVSAYGAAGSFVLILLWVYYSAQILLFGAEFAQVYAKRLGTAPLSPPKPSVVDVQPTPVPRVQPEPTSSTTTTKLLNHAERLINALFRLYLLVGVLGRLLRRGGGFARKRS